MLVATPRPSSATPRPSPVTLRSTFARPTLHTPPSGGGQRFAEIGAAAWRAEISASLATIFEALAAGGRQSPQIPRRRARRLVEDAIRRHDPQAEATLGPQAWDAMIVGILDANPDVEIGDA